MTPCLPPSAHVPRAWVDPITGPADALAVIDAARRHPAVPQIVVLVLDDHRYGGVVLVVDDIPDDDAIVVVTGLVGLAAKTPPRSGEPTGAQPPPRASPQIVLASIRPGHGSGPGDVVRWRCVDRVAAAYGITVLEWFVIGPSGIECPRHAAGAAARW